DAVGSGDAVVGSGDAVVGSGDAVVTPPGVGSSLLMTSAGGGGAKRARKSHACEMCGKAFRDVYHLNRHK
ncbi:MAZ protein, partial [Atlantisia rogersi]|nr:MAZ protein [Atlantisia rogersi]